MIHCFTVRILFDLCPDQIYKLQQLIPERYNKRIRQDSHILSIDHGPGSIDDQKAAEKLALVEHIGRNKAQLLRGYVILTIPDPDTQRLLKRHKDLWIIMGMLAAALAEYTKIQPVHTGILLNISHHSNEQAIGVPVRFCNNYVFYLIVSNCFGS